MFTHLHVHTQYSLLDGASKISDLVEKVKSLGMTALAITDHGNMYGAKTFHKTCKSGKIKPILGVEAYVANRSIANKTDQTDRSGNHLILLAKNKVGYMNLVKLVSISHTDGLYYKPRIDKDLLKIYKEGILVSSACLGGEVARAIRKEGLDKAELIVREYQEIFGDDYYLELMRHKTNNPEIDADTFAKQEIVNAGLIELSKRTGVKLIATNDSHFTNREDAKAHDILVCLSTGKDLNDPTRLKYTGQEYLKTPDEMAALFADVPEALANTLEVAEKIEYYDLDSPPIMPNFPIPEPFTDPNEYLRHIAYLGAELKFDEVTQVHTERLDFELETIKKMGFPGYFLIVWDFLKAARELDVAVGPGRGSAAGSAVAYCLGITNIDPIKYDLLFERFLNPDRISMPDIDIDFDEEGRERVLDWVVNKYGHEKVASLITFGKMAPKMAIRDVARVLQLPLQEADKLAKYIPEKPDISFKKAYEESAELREAKSNGSELVKSTLLLAETLEGSIRHTGTHACGIIIGRDDLTDHIPVSSNKDSNLLVTQFDGKHIEDVGMLKMDFLGLKTLSIIKDAVQFIKESENVDLDVDKLPLDDPKTFEIFAKGETTAIFQFESDGMKKYMKALQPNRLEDLIAMNALYRPGPLEYIPSFIRRKHGKEPISYDLPIMEETLKETYGITVYQEQVMILSRVMAGFTRGQADSLRKAMAKKIKAMMDDLKVKFVDGCKNNGLEEEKVLKVWADWEAFANYAFNKSHSTCYAFLAYQTAYIKAHYPAHFMAAVLSRNLNDIKKITTFMDECRRAGINVLGPDVNQSGIKFTVGKNSVVRFGMAAIKGVGEAAVEHIIAERNRNGEFKDIFDFVTRVDTHIINKRNLEALALSGALDCFTDVKRSQYFASASGDESFVDALLRFGTKIKNLHEMNTQSLFGSSNNGTIVKPAIPAVEDWNKLERLNKEKNLIGIYLSAHPLDEFKLEIDTYCNTTLSEFAEIKDLVSRMEGKDIKIAGIVTEAAERTTKTGKPYGVLTIEDYSDSYKLTLFNNYIDFKKYFTVGYSLLIEGRLKKRNPDPESEWEFKPDKMTLLHEAKAKMIKSVDVKLRINELTPSLIDELEAKAKNNKGDVMLQFIVYDPENEKIWVRLMSRAYKVGLSPEFIEFLNHHPAIEYKVY